MRYETPASFRMFTYRLLSADLSASSLHTRIRNVLEIRGILESHLDISAIPPSYTSATPYAIQLPSSTPPTPFLASVGF